MKHLSFRKLLPWLVVAAIVVFAVYRLKFRPTPVMAHVVATGEVRGEVMGTGTLEARVKTTISPRIQERLAEVLVDQGVYVKSGQLLARLDDAETKQQVAIADATLAAARATVERVSADEARSQAVLKQAQQDHQRSIDLLAAKITSQADFDKTAEALHVAEANLKSTQAAIVEAQSQVFTDEKTLLYQKEHLAFTEMRSPYDGLVTRRDRDPGGIVVPGSSILQLVATNEIWVSAWVDETAMTGLNEGQPARVVFRSEPAKNYAGEVARLGREADRETREFVVDVRVKALPENWTMGQRAEVFIETDHKSNVVVMPAQFVRWRDGKAGVFLNDHGNARWHGVTLGLRGLQNAEVTQGLAAGEQIIRPVEGQKQPLTDGQRIKAKMNLAVRDIRHNVGRFALTTVGIGLLLMIVMGMGGIYRGLIYEATLLVDQVGADLWVVQGSTRGPFAEVSRIPANLEDRVRAVPGVASARRFVSHTIQREHRGQPLRMVVQGLSWPEDKGDWVTLVAGRPLRQAHYEMIADRSLGLPLGEKLKLGKNVYEVVGLTKGMVGTGGDGLCFFTVSDAEAIQFDVPGEATRLERAARLARLENLDLGRVTPLLSERVVGPASGLPALALPQVSAVLVTVRDGADAARVTATLATWPDVTVYSTQQQKDLLLSGMVDKSKRQLGLFRALLIIISTIIMALILYTLTLDKIHDIALLKLIGARNGVIIGLILQQALLMGVLGYGLAWWLGQFAFPRFPRLVMIEMPDLLMLGGIVLAISVFASLLGIWKAMSVEPNKVLS